MTNLEAVRAIISDTSVNDASITANLELHGISPTAPWDASMSNPDRCKIYDIAIKLGLQSRGVGGIRSISEGGYSITYDDADKTVKNWALSKAKESGCSSLISEYTPNKIRDISYLLNR